MSMASHSTVTLYTESYLFADGEKTFNDVWSAITSTAVHTSLQLISYNISYYTIGHYIIRCYYTISLLSVIITLSVVTNALESSATSAFQFTQHCGATLHACTHAVYWTNRDSRAGFKGSQGITGPHQTPPTKRYILYFWLLPKN